MKPKYMNEHRHNKPPKKQINVNSGTTRNEQCTNMCANMFLPLAPSSSSNSNAAGCSQRFKYLFEKKIQSEQYKQCKQCNRFTWTEDNIIGTFFFHLTTSPTTRCGGGSIPPPEEPLPLSLPPPVVVHPWSLLPPYLHLLSRRLRRHL